MASRPSLHILSRPADSPTHIACAVCFEQERDQSCALLQTRCQHWVCFGCLSLWSIACEKAGRSLTCPSCRAVMRRARGREAVAAEAEAATEPAAAPHEDPTTRLASEQWLGRYSRRCPWCAAPVVKDDGCDLVTCTICLHLFCWACLCPGGCKCTPTRGIWNWIRDTRSVYLGLGTLVLATFIFGVLPPTAKGAIPGSRSV